MNIVNETLGIDAVSYTHLDVYKRQDVECVKVDDREFRDKVISHSKEVLASGDVRFTSELGSCETALHGMGRAEIEYDVLFHARAVLEEMGLENEVTLIGARVHAVSYTHLSRWKKRRKP